MAKTGDSSDGVLILQNKVQQFPILLSPHSLSGGSCSTVGIFCILRFLTICKADNGKCPLLVFSFLSPNPTGGSLGIKGVFCFFVLKKFSKFN